MKLRVTVKTRNVGSQVTTLIEIDREQWNDMSESEREEFMLESMFELIEWNYEEVESE